MRNGNRLLGAVVALAALPFLAGPARAGSDPGGSGHGSGSSGGTGSGSNPGPGGGGGAVPSITMPLGAVSRGWARYAPPYYMTVGPDGRLIMAPVWPVRPPVIVIDRGPIGGPVPPVLPPRPIRPVRVARPSDPGRRARYVTIGDRLFRAGNLKRAEERYEQAVRADPDSAAPRVRLAQVALVRDEFAEAARQLREAVAAEPDWLARAGNIEAVYLEPADFRRQIAKLESRVLREPADRDAWLVLGAELFLSGQTRRAADVFLRLSDRKPDPALAAFLDATAPVLTQD